MASIITLGTAEEFALIHAGETEYARTLHLRVLDAVRSLETGGAPGYAVNRLEHSLQSATRAERDGKPTNYVVAALVHDIGDSLAPYSHGSYQRRSCGLLSRRSCAGSSPITRSSRCTTTARTWAATSTPGTSCSATRGTTRRLSSANATTRTASSPHDGLAAPSGTSRPLVESGIQPRADLPRRPLASGEGLWLGARGDCHRERAG